MPQSQSQLTFHPTCVGINGNVDSHFMEPKTRWNTKACTTHMTNIAKRIRASKAAHGSSKMSGIVFRDNDRVYKAKKVLKHIETLNANAKRRGQELGFKPDNLPPRSPDLMINDVSLNNQIKNKLYAKGRRGLKSVANQKREIMKIVRSAGFRAACKKALTNYRKRLRAILAHNGHMVRQKGSTGFFAPKIRKGGFYKKAAPKYTKAEKKLMRELRAKLRKKPMKQKMMPKKSKRGANAMKASKNFGIRSSVIRLFGTQERLPAFKDIPDLKFTPTPRTGQGHWRKVPPA
jgi:hypothetical protein